MGTPFLGEIKLISWNFQPQGWAFCNGQFLPINQNQALFSILGTTYGGNGQTTFALPDLRGRAPVHRGSQFTLGQKGGEEFHTLTQSEMPQHIHFAQASNTTANINVPTGALLGNVAAKPYHDPTNLVATDPSSVSFYGGSQPHENRQPVLVVNFIIALIGIFPSRN